MSYRQALRLVIITLGFVAPAHLAVPTLWAASKTKKPPQPAAPDEPIDTSAYVGAETCKTCHEEIYKDYETTPHWKTMSDTRRGVAFQGCEACHGPGKAHVEGGGDTTKIFTFKGVSATAISYRCLGCHNYDQEHQNFVRGQHALSQVSCIDCHQPHHPKQPQRLLVASQPQLCFSCHQDVSPQFSRPFHHRVKEGLIRCTDCHNPHGGFGTQRARQQRASASQDIVCFNCHADKAGPFVYEHPPVKVEGCISCHVPHGSANPRLLNYSQINLLCLGCHTLTVDSSVPGVPSFHNQTTKYQACTLCHVAIHGSNFSAVYFK